MALPHRLTRRGMPAREGPYRLLLLLLPVLVKLPLLAGFLVVDPAALFTDLATAAAPGWWPGFPTIDPNTGYTSHALGTYAARELLAGRLPWWNPYEGIGAPLAGEMQSAALFPPTLLLALPNGQLLMHLILQVVAGLATFALLRTMRIAPPAALAGAVAFQFNGVFAWLANAAVNPIAFLPLMLLGIERQRRASVRVRTTGAAMIAGGVALSLYAGFPETAYLDGLFVGCWTLTRLFGAGRDRWWLLARIGIPAVAGVALATPILVAFVGYLPAAYVGLHANPAGQYTHLPAAYLPLAVLPWFLGGIFVDRPDFWGMVGGYAGLLLLPPAIAALAGHRDRALRLVIAAWIAGALALSYGATWLFDAISIVPGIKEAALYRYLPASWSMALCILAALGIDDIRHAGRRRFIAATTLAGAGVMLASVAGATVIGWLPHGAAARFACGVQILLLVAMAAAASSGRWSAVRRSSIVAALVATEAMFLFALPVFAYPRAVATAAGGVGFLRAHLERQRFVTFGPIRPNYGTAFGIAQINYNDLPTPRAWVAYARARLDARADPIRFAAPSSVADFLRHERDYADVGVRYVVTPIGLDLPGLPRVYADRRLSIHALPDPQPYFQAPGCALAPLDRTALTVRCSRPVRLLRLEAMMPGWTATINGAPAPVTTARSVFQSVDLPVGRSTVRFRYAPPGIGMAAIIAIAGLLLLGGWLAVVGRLNPRGRAP